MKIEINKVYKLKFLINHTSLTYTGIVIYVDNNFITFVDKFGEMYNYNLNLLISYEPSEDIDFDKILLKAVNTKKEYNILKKENEDKNTKTTTK